MDRPGLISIVSPIFRAPCFNAPPRTPPCSFSNGVPGLLMSKLRAIRKSGVSDSVGFVISTFDSSYSILSMFTPWIAETGIIGAFSATVPFTNCLIVL